MNGKEIVEKLGLQAHPEGGFYKETYRSNQTIETDKNVFRNISTAIYFLLENENKSLFHRIKSDETWYFHLGCDVLIYFFDGSKTLQTIQLGMGSKILQATIPAHTWFAAKPMSEDSFCLVSCAVAPGFEFDDFEIGRREDLMAEFGISAKGIQIIEALTRV